MHGKRSNSPLEAVLKPAVQVYQPVRNAGLAIAVVDRDGIYESRCFGNADGPRQSVRVDEKTGFALGSLTKAFTSLAAMMLVEEGGAELNRPVRDYDCDFAVMDPQASEEMTLEDLLSHRSGIHAHDALWYLTSLSRDDIYARLRYLEPVSAEGFGFRRGFLYNNNLYAAAGTVLERILHQPWSQFVKERILDPLGLADTFSLSSAGTHLHMAAPFSGAKPLAPRDYNNIEPAGGLGSNLTDVAGWLQLFLRAGTAPDGRRLLSEHGIAELYRPRIATGAGRQHYCLGWYTDQLYGRRLVWHNGTADGYSTFASFLPEEGFGVVALSNQNRDTTKQMSFPRRVAMRVYDFLLGARPPEGDDLRCEGRPLVEIACERPSSPRLAEGAAVPAVRGTYRHPAYDQIRVSYANGGLTLHYFDHRWSLVATAGGGFEFKLPAFGSSFCVQALLADDPIRGRALAIPFDPQASWIHFRSTQP